MSTLGLTLYYGNRRQQLIMVECSTTETKNNLRLVCLAVSCPHVQMARTSQTWCVNVPIYPTNSGLSHVGQAGTEILLSTFLIQHNKI